MVETAFCSPIKDDITEICAPAACSTGKGRIFHDDLHAFSTGGILFVNNGALRKERVSDGILFANSSKKYEKMPPETDGFWTSFTFKRLACYGTAKGIESATDPLPLPLR